MKAAEYRRMFEAEDTQWWYVGQRAIAHAILESRLTDPPEPREPSLAILDAGCGTGGNTVRLGHFGHAFGLDVIHEAAVACGQRGLPAVRGGILALPFRDDAFDLVTSFDVIYHAWVPDDGAALDEMVRVLRPGGRVLVRVPALKILWGAHDEAVQSRHRYTRPELEGLLEARGLRVERSTYCNSFLFPLLLARRTADRVLGRQGSDVGFLPAPLEWIFRNVMLLEAALIRRGVSLPIGASAIALARSPGG